MLILNHIQKALLKAMCLILSTNEFLQEPRRANVCSCWEKRSWNVVGTKALLLEEIVSRD